MKRKLTQTGKRTITLTREIIVEYPNDIDPELVDPASVEYVLGRATVEWEVEDEDFEIEDAEWSDADDGEEPDVCYEE